MTNLLKRLKKSTNIKGKEFVKDFNLLENKEDLFKQKDIDRSTLFSIQAPFVLLHTDIGDSCF